MNIKTLFLLPLFSLIVGCATLPDAVKFNAASLSGDDKRVAVLVRELPEAYTHKLGQQGLLDVAINNMAATGLTKHVKSLDFSEFGDLGDRLVSALAVRGIDSFIVDADVELPELESHSSKGKEGVYAKKDYTPLKEFFDADYLLVIDPSFLGTIRSYYGFMATSSPAAYYYGKGDIVDLSTNEILWLRRVNIQKAVEEWNEKDTGYPNLTNAIYQAVEEAHSLYIKEFEVDEKVPVIGE